MTLGPAAMLRAFTLDNLRWLCRELPQAQDTGRTVGWRSSCRPARLTGTAHGARRLLRWNRI